MFMRIQRAGSNLLPSGEVDSILLVVIRVLRAGQCMCICAGAHALSAH